MGTLHHYLLLILYFYIFSSGSKDSMDVLNDIDSMLQGLTDELDAMLEFEIP